MEGDQNENRFLISLLEGMTLEEKIGQMSQMEINALTEDDPSKPGQKRLDSQKANYFIGEMGIGSVLNYIPGADNQSLYAAEYRKIAMDLQQIAKDHGRPPVIWGLDSVHGANYVRDGTWSPSPLNLAATFNLTYAEMAGQWASQDTRAAGITWVFSPLLGLAWSPAFARVYETFGEDPHVVGAFATSMIRGIETPDLPSDGIPSCAAASAKHFIGYPLPRTGHDRAPSWIPRRHLYQYFVLPWERVMKETDVKTVMESYTETDGVPNVANPNHLNYLLRYRLNFTGVLVTDYQEINNLNSWHHIVKETDNSTASSTEYALTEGTVDMSMIPWRVDEFVSATAAAVRNKKVDESRINESAMRVLRLKQQLKMFDEEMTFDNAVMTTNGQKQALEMARDSLVLTITTSTLLPLRADSEGLKLLVTGPTSNSLISQTGGWTVTWQGPPDEKQSFSTGSTIYQAASRIVGKGLFSDVVYRCGVDILGEECSDDDASSGDSDGAGTRRNLGFFDELSDIGSDIKHGINDGIDGVDHWINGGGDSDERQSSILRAIAAAKNVDLVLIGVGEEAYAEKPGDIRSQYLPLGQLQLVEEMRENYPDKPIILVYFGGRPRLLDNAPALVDAVIIGFLPGPHGGEAVVDLLSGKFSPNGRLPITYPSAPDGGGVPYMHSVSDQCTTGEGIMPHWEYVQCPVQWPFGHGLSFANFDYSDLEVTGNTQDGVDVRVDLTNTGTMEAGETIMVFTFDDYRSTTPEYKRLRAFEKVFLRPNQKRTVVFHIPSEEFKFVGPHDDHHYIFDHNMSFRVGIGAHTDCRSDPSNVLCAHVEASSNQQHKTTPACRAACDLWINEESHSCASKYGLLSFNDCAKLCQESDNLPVTHASVGTEGWGWNYVDCLESVVWGFQQQQQTSVECGKMRRLCRDIFATKNMNEFGIGQGSVKDTTISLYSETGHNATASSTSILFALLAGSLGTLFVMLTVRGMRRRRNNLYNNVESTLSGVEMFSMSDKNAHEKSDVEEHNEGDSPSGMRSKASELLGRIEYYKRQDFNPVPTLNVS